MIQSSTSSSLRSRSGHPQLGEWLLMSLPLLSMFPIQAGWHGDGLFLVVVSIGCIWTEGCLQTSVWIQGLLCLRQLICGFLQLNWYFYQNEKFSFGPMFSVSSGGLKPLTEKRWFGLRWVSWMQQTSNLLHMYKRHVTCNFCFMFQAVFFQGEADTHFLHRTCYYYYY